MLNRPTHSPVSPRSFTSMSTRLMLLSALALGGCQNEHNTVIQPIGNPSEVRQIVRGHREKLTDTVRHTCIPSGAFNLSPEHDQLFLETWCLAITNQRPRAKQVDDIPSPRIDDWFPVPFKNGAHISITDDSGNPVLTLKYRDEKKEEHSYVLQRQENKAYEYNFSDLVPEILLPLAHSRDLIVE